jgi:hypothetical protein
MMTDPKRPTTEIIDAATNLRTEVGGLESMVLMVSELPEADDDATERILAQLLAADSAADLNRPWEASGLEQWFDRAIEIRAVTRAPSDFEDGIGVYVVIQAKAIGTGKDVVITTGSTAVIAQLIMAHRNGWLPIVATPRGPKRTPKSGRVPHHLEFSVVGDGR